MTSSEVSRVVTVTLLSTITGGSASEGLAAAELKTQRSKREARIPCGLTVKLRGRTEAPALGAKGAQFLSARGAKPQAHHGPLQRLLERHVMIESSMLQAT